jgi:hypothetical protein
MASGFEMMLKSMGFDPEKIKATLIEAKNEIMTQVTSVNEKLARIEAKLDAQTAAGKDIVTNAGSDDTNNRPN